MSRLASSLSRIVSKNRHPCLSLFRVSKQRIKSIIDPLLVLPKREEYVVTNFVYFTSHRYLGLASEKLFPRLLNEVTAAYQNLIKLQRYEENGILDISFLCRLSH